MYVQEFNCRKLNYVCHKYVGLLGEISDLSSAQSKPSEVEITWSPPYSLEGVPILGYESDVVIIAVSDGSVVEAYHDTVNNTRLAVSKPESAQGCLYVNTSVLAFNKVGNGTAIHDIFYFRESMCSIYVHVATIGCVSLSKGMKM